MTAYVDIPAGLQDADYTLTYSPQLSLWQAWNNHTGVVDYSNSDFATVFNQTSAKLTAYGLAFTHTINGATCYYAFPPALTVGAPTPGGSVDTGDHFYAVSAVSATGESIVGYAQSVTIGANHTVPLSNIPIGPAGTTARKIYRTLSTTVTPPIAGVGPGPLITDARPPDLSEYYVVTTLADNSSTTYTDTAADAAIVPNGPATNFAPSYSDGGAISIGRPPSSVSVSGQRYAIAVTQTLQMYAQQTLTGRGRGWTLMSTSSVAQQYGTLNSNVLATDTTIDVIETITPPATPFAIGVKFSSTGAETMLVTNRVNVSGNRYTYTVNRGLVGSAGFLAGWGVPAQANTAGNAVVGCSQGRAQVGAGLDQYHADRIRTEGISFNGNSFSIWGCVQKRTQVPAGGSGTSSLGGNQSTSYTVFNEFTGSLGPEYSLALPNDISATSNNWIMFNRINGKDSTGLMVSIGDGHIKFNNISGGAPAIFSSASSITYLGNHIANTISTYGDVYITSGSNMHFIGNYMDSIGNGMGAFYRPPNLSATKDIQFIGNRYSCSTVTDSLTNIINLQSAVDRVQVVGEHFHGGNALCNLINNAGGADWLVDAITAQFTPLTTFVGTKPSQIGQMMLGQNTNRYSQNKIVASLNGTGSATNFTVAHHLFSTPATVQITAQSSAAAADYWWTADATNITITYAVAPAPGTNNVVLSVFCSV